MTPALLLVLCFLIGCVTGLRSMTGIALVCWGTRLGWLHLHGTKLSFLASTISLIVFSLFALGELVADKLPQVPARTTAGPLITRILFGALCAGALALSAGVGWIGPAVLGAVGAVAGAFAGRSFRKAIASRGHVKDLPVALLEDAVAILLGLFVVSRF